jgi:hypothetical protein
MRRAWCVVVVCGVVLWCGAASGQGWELKPTGRVGLRHEVLTVGDGDSDQEAGTEVLRNRPEASFALGVQGALLEGALKGELRLRSGPSKSPSDGWVPLATLGSLEGVYMDRAWLGGSLVGLPELELRLGRTPLPWTRTGLVWDPDVTLPGAVVQYARESRGVWRRAALSLAGLYLGTGDPESEDELAMWAGDVGATWGIGRSLQIEASLGYFDLVGRRKLGQAIAADQVRVGRRKAGFTTNTTDTDATTPTLDISQRLAYDGLGSDFNVVTGYLSARWEAARWLPLSLFGQLAWNAGARGLGEDNDLGWVAGLRVGEATAPGRGELVVQRLYIEADATLALYNKDAWLTNAQGWEVNARFIAWEGLYVGFEGMLTWQVDPMLRGFGDDRGEAEVADPTAVRVRAVTGWDF